MAANTKGPSQIVGEFDLVGQIFSTMEGPKKDSTKNKHNRTTVQTQKQGAEVPVVTEKNNVNKETKMAATSRCETITRPPPISDVMESTNVTSSEFMSLSRLVSGFTMSMQDIMKSQAEEQTKLMRSLLTDQRRECDSAVYDRSSDEGPDSDSESGDDVDICDQIDQLLAAPKPKDTVQTTDNKIPDFLTKLEQDFSTDDVTGAAITDTTVVGLVNNALTKRMAEDKLKQKLSAYPRPINIEALQSPRVNPEVWRKIKMNTKTQDVKFQQIQNRITKGLTPLVQMASDMCERRQTDKPVETETLDKFLKCTLDSVTMLGSAMQDLSQRRKELIRPDLNAQYAPLCSSSVPVTTFLFGDDLHKSMKEMDETNRVAQKVSRDKRYYHQYGNQYGNHYGNQYGNQRYRPYHTPHKKYDSDRGGYSGRGHHGAYNQNSYQTHKKSKNFKKGADRKQ